MRIVHLSTLHGALDVRIFHKQCRTLAAAGHEVHLVVPEPPSAQRDGVRFHAFARPADTLRPLRISRRLAAMYAQAAALRADVYHFHDPELITVGLALQRTGARVVYDVHEDAPVEARTLNPDRPWNGRLKACAFGLLDAAARCRLDAFVCATPAIARKFPARRTVTVQNFPRTEEFSGSQRAAQAYRSRPLNIAYVGGVTAIRGAREMVRALEHLPSAALELAGPFAPPGLRQELERLPGWRNVRYLGVQPREAVGDLLGRARLGLVLFHPERDHLEAMPNKLFEYMAAGLPVVASDFPLWRGIIAEAGCGLTVDPLDPAAIAGAVQRLLDDPAAAEAMGQRGLQAVAGRYNWEAEAARLLDLYRRLEAAKNQQKNALNQHDGKRFSLNLTRQLADDRGAPK